MERGAVVKLGEVRQAEAETAQPWTTAMTDRLGRLLLVTLEAARAFVSPA